MEVPTNSTRRSQAEEDDIAALSVMQQLDELVQHDGDGGDTHAVLQCVIIQNMLTKRRRRRIWTNQQMQDMCYSH